MNRDFGKKLRVASLRRHDSQPLQTLFALVRKSSLPIVHTGFVQRGLPRSSPKNAAAPLYEAFVKLPEKKLEGFLVQLQQFRNIL